MNQDNFSLAHAYYSQGKFKDAMDAYREVIKSEPENVLAHYWLGWSYSQLGRYESAKIEFDSVVRLAPDSEGTQHAQKWLEWKRGLPQQVKKEEPGVVQCARCGTQNPVTNKFCGQCSANLISEATPAASPQLERTTEEKEIKEELVQSILKNIKVEVKTSTMQDDSIIDVTGGSYSINQANLKKYKTGVPFWKHQYVYSYSEINGASSEQVKFYNDFKESFLNDEHFDLEGNTNYAFILFFDLLNEYENYKDLVKLENQLNILGQCYPKTKSYATSPLIQKMEAAGDRDGIERLRNKEKNDHQNYYQNNLSYTRDNIDEYHLGNRYAKKLKLSHEEVSWLNKFWIPINVFRAIEGCCIETIKLYLTVVKELNKNFKDKETSFSKEVDFLQSEVLKFYKDNSGDSCSEYDISYLKNGVESEVFVTIFKRAENSVREVLGHKRKISTDFPYSGISSLQKEFENRIGNSVNQIIQSLASTITQPDEITELELNTQGDTVKRVLTPEQKQVYSDRFRKMREAQKEKKSDEKKKETTPTTTASPVTTPVSPTKEEQKTEPTTTEAKKDYESKRKKINLDATTINEVQQQDKRTVELLSEYLKDEYEDENTNIKTEEINNEEVKIEITTKSEFENPFANGVTLNQIQTEAIFLFTKSSFRISQTDIDSYCKSKSIFKSQLIDSINESCYETLDDALIEEDGETYILNENYYKKITAK